MDPSSSPEETMSNPPKPETSSSPDALLKAQSSKPPSLKTGGDPSVTNMTASSTPLRNINAARRPGLPAAPARSSQLNQDMAAKMKAFHMSRQGLSSAQESRSASTSGNLPSLGPHIASPPGPLPNGALTGGLASPSITHPGSPLTAGPGGLPAVPGGRPTPPNLKSAPAVPNVASGPKMGLAAKRGMKAGMKLSDATGPSPQTTEKPADATMGASEAPSGQKSDNLFNKYAEYVDTKTGTLSFKGKATLHGQGVDFSSGSSFSISLDEVDTLDELGKGNYGTVYKVRHSRPRIRKPGQGLSGNRAPLPDSNAEENNALPMSASGTSGVVMAMKEIRLELDEAKFAAIIMELDILHRCVSPFIIDFYGAFFQEGAVYICMEFMNGGSIDKLYGDGVPEPVLRKIALATVMGLKSLKDEHNIIHRDVKPTNILINTKGQVKICDFGVSGNLVASIAKTNIGCQSYMAPERISGGGVAQAGANPGGGTYSVQSDIWSLGLTIIECAMGQYPYPPETYDNIFSQLSAIVEGAPPDLPEDRFSLEARDFVRGALNKIPKLRPTYAMLLGHPWLATLLKPPTITEEDEDAEEAAEAAGAGTTAEPGVVDKEVSDWVNEALERKRNNALAKKAKPALHAAPLDTVPSSTS